jgi:starch phosphorylase
MVPVSAQHPVAFFCAEFGVDSALPIYAGGLGILAGDILKEAADQQLPYVGVGLLYRGGGAIQTIDADGKQIETDCVFDPLAQGLEHVYLEEMPLFIKVHLTEVSVWLRCWQKKIGPTVTLYLLDPDTEQNPAQYRRIAHELYAGTEEQVIQQQLLLGIGGVKLLHTLGIHPGLYHVNEGRPSFLHWQLIRSYMDQGGASFSIAHEMAKQKTVYTNHTLVEAGNQLYRTHLLRVYGKYYADKMGISVTELLQPGLDDATKQFSVTKYALETSRKASAVSKLHFDFCQKQWPSYEWVSITNGVHLPTWQSPEFSSNVANVDGDQEKTAAKIWSLHQANKQKLADFVRQRTGFGYDPNRLVLTWARRVTGYKQLSSLCKDLPRLQRILRGADGAAQPPMQLLVAGKAHIYDIDAKTEIQEVIHHMQQELSGNALFIPNLDMELDMMLTRGSDVWLNTPDLGKEACGTSGMKALSNGVLQCTIADGWANEVNWDGLGWTLEPGATAESLYDLLETQIGPWYARRDAAGIPQEWVAMMKKSIDLSIKFSSTRMMDEYQALLYA